MLNRIPYRIVPLEFAFVDRIRRTLRDDFGHALQVSTNAGAAPCRFTLRPAEPGEEMILLSYSPFSGAHPYAEVGPIFMRRHGDVGYADLHRFPPALDPVTRVFRAYNEREEIVAARVGSPDPDTLISELFAQPSVTCIHVRALAYGCFTFKITRA